MNRSKFLAEDQEFFYPCSPYIEPIVALFGGEFAEQFSSLPSLVLRVRIAILSRNRKRASVLYNSLETLR